jgi:hypothetical protein
LRAASRVHPVQSSSPAQVSAAVIVVSLGLGVLNPSLVCGLTRAVVWLVFRGFFLELFSVCFRMVCATELHLHSY